MVWQAVPYFALISFPPDCALPVINITAPYTWCSLLACFTHSIFTISLQDRLLFPNPTKTLLFSEAHSWLLCENPRGRWCSLCAMISVSSACWVTASPGCCVTRTPSAPLCLVPHAAPGVICSPAGLVCKSASPVQGTEPVQRASGTGITNISFQNAQRVERSQGLASLDHAWKVQPSKLH